MGSTEIDIIGSTFVRRDKLGRRRHPNQLNFVGVKCYTETLGTIRVDKEMKKQLHARAKRDKRSIAQKIREYIEWGLENDR